MVSLGSHPIPPSRHDTRYSHDPRATPTTTSNSNSSGYFYYHFHLHFHLHLYFISFLFLFLLPRARQIQNPHASPDLKNQSASIKPNQTKPNQIKSNQTKPKKLKKKVNKSTAADPGTHPSIHPPSLTETLTSGPDAVCRNDPSIRPADRPTAGSVHDAAMQGPSCRRHRQEMDSVIAHTVQST